VWVHRRALRREDAEHYAAHVGRPGPPHLPRTRHGRERRRADGQLHQAHLDFGWGDLAAAREALAAGLRGRDPSPKAIGALARRLRQLGAELRRHGQDEVQGRRWLAFALAEARAANGRDFAAALAGALAVEEAAEHLAAGRRGAARRALLRALAARPSLVLRDARVRGLARAGLRPGAGRDTTRPSAAGPR
jgi:hypothetical protein